MIRDELNKITERIIGIAFDIHKLLGPGFNEKVYAQALKEEFSRNKVKNEKEKNIKVEYKDRLIGEQRIDFLVENEVILELKAVEYIGKIHLAQMLSYLKILDKRIGLILNFANTKLEIKRVVNKF